MPCVLRYWSRANLLLRQSTRSDEDALGPMEKKGKKDEA